MLSRIEYIDVLFYFYKSVITRVKLSVIKNRFETKFLTHSGKVDIRCIWDTFNVPIDNKALNMQRFYTTLTFKYLNLSDLGDIKSTKTHLTHEFDRIGFL